MTSDQFVNWAIVALNAMATAAVEWIAMRGDTTWEPSDDRACDRRSAHLRIYTIRLRKMSEFIGVFDRLAMAVQLKYLERPLGMFTSAVGPLNQIVHFSGFPNMGDFERRHAARDKDPDWPGHFRASGHLIVAQENRLIRRIELRFLLPPGAQLFASKTPAP